MTSVWKCAAVAIMVMTGPRWCPAGSGNGHERPESALVVLTSRFFEGQRAGNGFVVGDGTLVVTCDHLVYERSENGGHRMEGLVTVFSPYLGRACDARIVASDEELDLAVLEVPWKGHPSLSLGDVNDVMDARSARIVGLPAVVQCLDNLDSAVSAEGFAAQEEELPVAFVGVRRRSARFITLSGAKQVGAGWSGSALVLPGTSVAIGCFHMIHSTSRYEQGIRREAVGSAICQVQRLLGDGLDATRLRRADALLERPEDAAEACRLALRASSSLRPGSYESALDAAHALVRLRPESGFGHRVLAYANEKLGRTEAARESYRRATELDPNSLRGQLLHAQFLGAHGDADKARQILESLWQTGRSRGLVGIALVNLVSGQKELSRCLEILDEASCAEPRNAYLWQQMTACRMQMQGPAGAIDPLTRAVELWPERGPLRGSLARLLETTGNLDEAEKHFRKLLDAEPDNPVVYYRLAEFLSKHRPDAAPEAFLRARKALDLPARASLPREKIEQLIATIQEQ